MRSTAVTKSNQSRLVLAEAMYRLRCSAICSLVDISDSQMTLVLRLLDSACAPRPQCGERPVTLPARAIGPAPEEGEKLDWLPADGREESQPVVACQETTDTSHQTG
jgi:hypothetical protein